MGTEKAYDRQLVDAYDRPLQSGASGQHILQKDCEALESPLVSTQGAVLDIPCGTGAYMAALRDQGHNVIGADASLPMLELARQRNPDAPGNQCDINHLPFRDSAFDAVITIRLFSHFQQEELLPMLREPRRVIKPGGRVVFDTFRWTPRQWPLSGLFLNRSHMVPISPRDVEEIIADAGLRRVDERWLYLFSPLWQRKLPLWAPRGMNSLERVLPPRWLLRSFWACTKD